MVWATTALAAFVSYPIKIESLDIEVGTFIKHESKCLRIEYLKTMIEVLKLKMSPGEASTRCNATTKCISGVRDKSPVGWKSNTKSNYEFKYKFKISFCNIFWQGSFCGPFLLSKPFWVDGGSCVLEGDSPGDQGGRFDISSPTTLWFNVTWDLGKI